MWTFCTAFLDFSLDFYQNAIILVWLLTVVILLLSIRFGLHSLLFFWVVISWLCSSDTFYDVIPTWVEGCSAVCFELNLLIIHFFNHFLIPSLDCYIFFAPDLFFWKMLIIWTMHHSIAWIMTLIIMFQCQFGAIFMFYFINIIVKMW